MIVAFACYGSIDEKARRRVGEVNSSFGLFCMKIGNRDFQWYIRIRDSQPVSLDSTLIL